MKPSEIYCLQLPSLYRVFHNLASVILRVALASHGWWLAVGVSHVHRIKAEISQESYQAVLSPLSKSFTAKGKSASNDSRTWKQDWIKKLLKPRYQWTYFRKIGMLANSGYVVFRIRTYGSILMCSVQRWYSHVASERAAWGDPKTP